MERQQFIVPLIYKKKIMELCHGEIAGYLGVIKTNLLERFLSHLFGPQCYPEIERVVQFCECQNVGKNSDEKKVPLKLFPLCLSCLEDCTLIK